jgi:hypothetical protein
MREDFSASVRRDTIPLLIGAAEGKLAARLLPEEGVDGRTMKVLEISGAGIPAIKLFIDEKNMIARQTFSTPGPDGRPVQADEIFSDYRLVDGLQVPFRADVRRAGRVILSRTLTRVVLNSPLDQTVFARPVQ